MKSIKLLFIALLASLTIISCSKDDEELLTIEGNKYEVTYVKIHSTIGEFVSSNVYSTKESLEESNLYGIIELKSDGKLWTDDNETGTWKQDGTSVTITEDGESVTGNIVDDIIKTSFTFTNENTTTVTDMHYTKM